MPPIVIFDPRKRQPTIGETIASSITNFTDARRQRQQDTLAGAKSNLELESLQRESDLFDPDFERRKREAEIGALEQKASGVDPFTMRILAASNPELFAKLAQQQASPVLADQTAARDAAQFQGGTTLPGAGIQGESNLSEFTEGDILEDENRNQFIVRNGVPVPFTPSGAGA